MKVSFQYGLAGYTGKANGLVFCYNWRSGKVYARTNTRPKIGEQNHKLGSITANLHSLKPSTGYIYDLRIYLIHYNGLPENADKRVYSWVNLYLKMMHNLSKMFPEIDLKTITKDYIYANNLPCLSVYKAVESGLLPEVKDWQILNHLM